MINVMLFEKYIKLLAVCNYFIAVIFLSVLFVSGISYENNMRWQTKLIKCFTDICDKLYDWVSFKCKGILHT